MFRTFDVLLPGGIARRFVADETGASLVEYAILIGLVLASISSISAVGAKISWAWGDLNNNWTGPPPPTPSWSGNGPSFEQGAR